MTSLKPTEKPVLNLEKYQDPLKYRIAQTIIQHYDGKIGQEELDNLVMSQVQRVSMPVSQPYIPIHHGTQSYQTSSSSQLSAGVAGINWNALQNAVKSVNPGDQAPPVSSRPPVHPGDEEYDEASMQVNISCVQSSVSQSKKAKLSPELQVSEDSVASSPDLHHKLPARINQDHQDIHLYRFFSRKIYGSKIWNIKASTTCSTSISVCTTSSSSTSSSTVQSTRYSQSI